MWENTYGFYIIIFDSAFSATVSTMIFKIKAFAGIAYKCINYYLIYNCDFDHQTVI